MVEVMAAGADSIDELDVAAAWGHEPASSRAAGRARLAPFTP